jgi:hypothetical protein
MSTDSHDVFEPEPKPAAKTEVKAEPKPKADDAVRPANLTEAELAGLRKDIRRMWSPEPEETR